MTSENLFDYATSGMTVQTAMLDSVKRFPNRGKAPRFLLWSGHLISTAHSMNVPSQGMVRIEFLHSDRSVRQGIDLDTRSGWIQLPDGEQIPILRTWRDEHLPDSIEYRFYCPERQLWVWNVYEVLYPGGRVVAEKWTENAGFWRDSVSETEQVYHCSHGMAHPPDFDSLVFKITIRPA